MKGVRIKAQIPLVKGCVSKQNKFWNFVDNGDTAELQLFGTIESEESWWSEDCVTYRNFIQELNALGKKDTINVVIHSTGGDVFAANAIYTELLLNPASITGTVLGVCASAATIILMACDKRRIAKNGILMAHNPLINLRGNYQVDDLVKLVEITNTVKKSIMTAYMDRLDKTEEEISSLMDEESWYVGQEAIDAGFCNELIESDVQNNMFSNKFLVDGVSYTFKNYLETFVPANIRKKVQALSDVDQKALGTFFNTKNTKKGKENMEEEETKTTVQDIKDVQTLKREYPALCAQVEKEAVDKERERLKAIDEIAAGVPADVLEKAKYTDPVSVADLALAQMRANNKAGINFMNDLEEDLSASGADGVSTEPNTGYNPAEKGPENSQKVNRLAAKLNMDKRRGRA